MFFNLKNTFASLDHLTSWFHNTVVEKKNSMGDRTGHGQTAFPTRKTNVNLYQKKRKAARGKEFVSVNTDNFCHYQKKTVCTSARNRSAIVFPFFNFTRSNVTGTVSHIHIYMKPSVQFGSNMPCNTL